MSEICILKTRHVSMIPLDDPSAKGRSSLAFSRQSTTLFSFPTHPERKIDNLHCSTKVFRLKLPGPFTHSFVRAWNWKQKENKNDFKEPLEKADPSITDFLKTACALIRQEKNRRQRGLCALHNVMSPTSRVSE